MGGMLYKDFLAVKGKKIIIIVLVCTLLFIAMRLALPGADMVKSGETGEEMRFADGNMIDAFLWMLPSLFTLAGLGLPSLWLKGIIAQDEKNKIRAFTKSLPLGKNAYIASKYIFLAVAVYAAMSMELIWCEIYFSRSGDNSFTDLVKALQSFLIIFSSASLFFAGIELPFFISLGSKKATGIKSAILELLFLFVIGWFFFGNLDVFEKMDLFNYIEWTKTHEFEINMMIVLCPVISTVLYFLSYKLSCAVNRNREADIDG
jgi:hypothetical protein